MKCIKTTFLTFLRQPAEKTLLHQQKMFKISKLTRLTFCPNPRDVGAVCNYVRLPCSAQQKLGHLSRKKIAAVLTGVLNYMWGVQQVAKQEETRGAVCDKPQLHILFWNATAVCIEARVIRWTLHSLALWFRESYTTASLLHHLQ
jgi:hypothetical protein